MNDTLFTHSQLQQHHASDPLVTSNTIAGPSQPTQRFRPYPSTVHHVTKGRYITSNDPRGYIPVYEYPLNGQWIMMDVDDGYILWTGIWKALGNAKADIVKMIESQPDLAPQLRRVRGGYLKIQGTWMPHEVAIKLAQRVAYPIKDDLVPFFGPNFPDSCLRPDQPGYGQVIPNPSGRRKARRVAANIQTRGLPPSSHSHPSSALAATGTTSFTLPSAGLSFHTVQPHQSAHPYAVHHPQHAISAAQHMDYQTLAVSHHPSHLAMTQQQQQQQQQQHHPHPLHMQHHEIDTMVRPSSAPLSTQSEPPIGYYNFYTPPPPNPNDSYNFPGPMNQSQPGVVRSAGPDATTHYEHNPNHQSNFQIQQDSRSDNEYNYHSSGNYGTQPQSAGAARSERAGMSRSHRYLPYPNPNNPTAFNTGHAVNPNNPDSAYSVTGPSYQFPLQAQSTTPTPTSDTNSVQSLHTHTSTPPLSSAYDSSAHRVRHSPQAASENVSSSSGYMLPPLTASSNTAMIREKESENVVPQKELVDSLAYSLPPISSLETTREHDKGDSAAVLKRLRTDESNGRSGRDRASYMIPPEVNMARRRSISEPPFHGGQSLAHGSAAVPGSHAWGQGFPETQGWAQPTNTHYTSLHTNYTHHRANSGGIESGQASNRHASASQGRPASSMAATTPSRQDQISTASSIPSVDAWSGFSSGIDPNRERHLRGSERDTPPIQPREPPPPHQALGAVDGTFIQVHSTSSPRPPDPSDRRHHVGPEQWTHQSAEVSRHEAYGNVTNAGRVVDPRRTGECVAAPGREMSKESPSRPW